MQPRFQQHRIDGACQEIVDTRLQRADVRVMVGNAGNDNDRNMSRSEVSLQPLAHLKTVHYRHHQVEQNNVRGIFRDQLERFRAAIRLEDGITFGREKTTIQFQILGHIVDNKHGRAIRVAVELDEIMCRLRHVSLVHEILLRPD